MLGCRVFGQSAGDYVTNGLADIANQDLVNANSNFLAALTLEPTNEDANVLLAVTRLLLVPQTPAGSNFLNGLNFPSGGRDIFNWTSAPPKDAFGGPTFPVNYNSTNIVFFFRTNVMPLVAASLTNLANLTDTNFLLTFTVTLPDVGQVTNTIDYGDVQMFRAGLNAANFFSYTLDANNASFILPQIVGFADTNGLTIQRVLSTYPSLLTPHNTNDLIPSENALESAATFYFIASDFIRNDRSPDDTNDLITLSPDEVNAEANFRTGLSNVLSSLTAPTQVDPNDPDSVVYLGPYFSGTNSVRKLVPQFFNDTYVDNTLPDYTFAGMLPDEPPYKTETALRKEFPSRSGIYIGDNGVSDNTGFGTGGSFAVFVNANGQGTILGNDNGDGTGNNSFGFVVNFTLNSGGGDWEVTNSVFNAFGSIDKHGDFNGEIDYQSGNLSGTSVFLNATEASPLGSFQNSAGLYAGSFSGTGSGTLNGVLAADGELFFVPTSARKGAEWRQRPVLFLHANRN